ncbi:TetR/AcrR family transcriptional regulator [Psychromonas marina]
MKTEQNSTRQHIISTGYQLFSAQGFTRVGLAEILKTADVPKGSFYHYFKSKELFGEAIIEDYFDSYLKRLATLFAFDPTQTALEQLMSYWQLWLSDTNNGCDQNRCLVVKLSAEVADLSDAMRLALRNGSEQVIKHIEACIKAGIKDNSIYQQNPTETANTLYSMWLGASLLSKLHRDQTILQQTLIQTRRLLSTATIIEH